MYSVRSGGRAAQKPVEEAQISDTAVAAWEAQKEEAVERRILADAAVRSMGIVRFFLIERQEVLRVYLSILVAASDTRLSRSSEVFTAAESL
ncbi:hypothetical protein M433DRAFT_9802 [Acidomyces richmondensis BFW]|nr:hypothetical protein M433DRAFT_9802 [Acidomyces richmondensis BFW]